MAIQNQKLGVFAIENGRLARLGTDGLSGSSPGAAAAGYGGIGLACRIAHRNWLADLTGLQI
jgi:hypothetical protein